MTQRRIYQEEFPYFITWRTREGFALFESREYAELLSHIIFNAGRMKKFDIMAYQIMPDHVHLLVWMGSAGRDTRARRNRLMLPSPAQVSAPALGHRNQEKVIIISDFMYTIKSFFIKEIRKQYGIKYSIWQKRFYTRIVDTDTYFNRVIAYIRHNPDKAGLPTRYRRGPYQYFQQENM